VTEPGPAPLPGSVRAAAQVFVADLSDCEPEAHDARHLSKVLRLRPGETVIASDGAGAWRQCAFRGSAPWLEPAGEAVSVPKCPQPVVVAFVPVKGDRPEWVVQKLTEIGVDQMVVLRSARSVVVWDGDRAERALERLKKVATQAAAQSRRAWIPDVQGVSDLTALAASGDVVLAQPGGGPVTVGAPLCVGPEGGWSQDELEVATELVGLGDTVLRAETAAVVVGALACALRDQRVLPGSGIGPVHGSGSLHPPR
jgi:16S rRNA (uracil1498-N3)-methyltransferase